MSGEDRKRSLANLRGIDAERIALCLLIMKGYWPLARRYLAHSGEIDLVMKRGRTIVAVEVKSRPDFDAAIRTLTPAKQQRIARAMQQFRARRNLDDRYICRYDAVLVVPWRWPQHIENIGPLE